MNLYFWKIFFSVSNHPLDLHLMGFIILILRMATDYFAVVFRCNELLLFPFSFFINFIYFFYIILWSFDFFVCSGFFFLIIISQCQWCYREFFKGFLFNFFFCFTGRLLADFYLLSYFIYYFCYCCCCCWISQLFP